MGAGGSIIGKLLGSAIGTAVAPGIGTTIGGALGGAIGGSVGNGGGAKSPNGSAGGSSQAPKIGGGAMQNALPIALSTAQLIRAAALKRKAAGSAPSRIDPQDAQYQAELANMRNGRVTGAAYGDAIRQLRMNQQAANQNITNRAGGYGGAAIAGYGNVVQATGDAYGKIFQNDEATKAAYEKLYSDNLDQMVQRRADLDINRHAQDEADWRSLNQAGSSNLLAAVNRIQPARAGMNQNFGLTKPPGAPGGQIGSSGTGIGAMRKSLVPNQKFNFTQPTPIPGAISGQLDPTLTKKLFNIAPPITL